jgi:lipopolysaccharide/colanic/teichoic acid biosynthesis glycosyltransferase/SAM-dependent methyltransferase
MPYMIQRAIAGVGLLILGPLILGLAVLVRLTTAGPAFYRATRARPGGTFTLYKIRTMREGSADGGPGITATGDQRVTRVGRVLRRAKLDELPQLWNVVRGDMALVGPRPEDPRYVDLADPLHARIFSALPGITGPTALAYRDEETILGSAAREIARSRGRDESSDEDVDRAYREIVLPAKLTMDDEYLSNRSFLGDIASIGRTIFGGQHVVTAGPESLDDLRDFTEWGGTAWIEMVESALEQMGDLTNRRVLEIGSRGGRMASLFALRGASVVGIDIAQDFREAASEQVSHHGVADLVRFLVDDGRLSSVQGEQFDIVFTKSVLVVIPDRAEYVLRIRDVLRPGGLLVAIENGRGGLVAAWLRRARRTFWDHRRIAYFEESDIKVLSATFTPVHIRKRRMPPIWLFVGRRAN